MTVNIPKNETFEKKILVLSFCKSRQNNAITEK